MTTVGFGSVKTIVVVILITVAVVALFRAEFLTKGHQASTRKDVAMRSEFRCPTDTTILQDTLYGTMKCPKCSREFTRVSEQMMKEVEYINTPQ